jgi:hypothetical protein
MAQAQHAYLLPHQRIGWEEGVMKLVINRCNRHNFWSVSIEDEDGGTRITPGKCCGSWSTVKEFNLSASDWRDIEKEARLAAEAMENPMPTNPAAVSPLDVLARDVREAQCSRDCSPEDMRADREGDEALAAIRELLAADREYDERLKDFNNTSATLDYWPHVYSRWQESVKRRAAALARFEGVGS